MTLIKVTHFWTDEKGCCYDCGDPALYCAPDLYGEDKPLGEANLFCPVCAAYHAACEGERIVSLFPEDSDPIADRQIADQFPSR